MKNGVIRIRFLSRGITKFYYTSKFMHFLRKVQELSGNTVMTFDVYWNGWHPCHTISDVKSDLKRFDQKESSNERVD